MKNFGMDERKQYTPRLPPSKAGHEFETRSLAATCRGFTFYVANPLSSIHELTRTEAGVTRFVTIRLFVS
jgi:hypothetical protein